MKESEMVKLRNASLAMTLILNMDESATCSRVDLEPGERHFIQGCQAGLIKTLQSQTERLEKMFTLAKSERDQACQKSFDLQGYLFSANSGKPTSPADANGKLIKKDKKWDNETPDGINEKDGVQGELPSEANQVEVAPAVPNAWAIAPGVPQHVELALVDAVRSGKTQAAAIALVNKATTITKPELEGHIEHLIRDGKLKRESKTKLSVPEKPATPNLQEIILREVRNGPTSLTAVVTNVSFESGQTDQEVEIAFHELSDQGRLEKTEAGWVVIEPDAVLIPEEMWTPPAEGSSKMEHTGPDSPTVVAILAKLHSGMTNKPTIIEAVGMQVGVPADAVKADWETLVFQKRIERTPDGFVAVQPATVAS